MKYHAVATAMTVLAKGKAIFDETATTIYIEDEAAGPYLVIRQSPDGKGDQEIAISAEEWPLIRDTIERMLEICKLVDPT